MKASEILAALEAGKVVSFGSYQIKSVGGRLSRKVNSDRANHWLPTGLEFECLGHHSHAKVIEDFPIHESEFFAKLREGCVLEREDGLKFKADGADGGINTSGINGLWRLWIPVISTNNPRIFRIVEDE